jgi:hypothetical protein
MTPWQQQGLQALLLLLLLPALLLLLLELLQLLQHPVYVNIFINGTPSICCCSWRRRC